MIKYTSKISLALIICIIAFQPLFGQTEVQPWGNIQGIRIDGQLMEFETNISVVQKDWKCINATGKEKQRPKYVRNGNHQIISTNIDSLYFTEVVDDAGKGRASVNIQVTSHSDTSLEGVYISFSLPGKYFSKGSIQLDNLKAVKLDAPITLLNNYLQIPASSVQFIAPNRYLEIAFTQPSILLFKSPADKESGSIQFYIPIQKGDIKKGQMLSSMFSLKASGLVDKKPLTFTLNTKITGRVFDGLGGNFRLQNPATDPQVIDYSLKNLRVAWGRVEMPWRFWQPAIDTNPVMEAKAGRLNVRVQKAMEMAQRLNKIGMPVILSAWSAPSWAIVGTPKFRPGPDGVWGNPLDDSRVTEIYQSIADYISYLKEQYGVEAALFSFNESDLGINIRQTGEEHAKLIKGLGAYLASRGLKTKLLLGDNSDATTYKFIYAALNDPSTHPYIGAISFHSWRGWETETLQQWANAATKLNVPLLVGEGSIDAAAWAYPAIFEEQIYALEEINLYTRLLAICQPASILQWQLTADYSPMAGGGIFGDTTPLRPLQRFWNLKQLATTPKGLKAMPLQSEATNVSCAAMGDNAKAVYALHFVNSGATRNATIVGIPGKVKSLRILVTDKKRAIEAGHLIPVVNGTATFLLNATSYTTLISN